MVIGTPDHMHATCALACMQLGKHVYVEKPLTRTAWEARLLAEAAEKYKVATQMGNQGYSHDATRVACEIIWSGEIGEVREVHAWHGRPGWPQGMQKIPAADAGARDARLGPVAGRRGGATVHRRRRRVSQVRRRLRGCRTASARRRVRRLPGGGRGGGFGGGAQFGFYLPFNWRGFYDFGSGLIGDWGVHILGPANWALQLSPQHLISVECIKKEGTGPFTFPVRTRVKYEFGARGNCRR